MMPAILALHQLTDSSHPYRFSDLNFIVHFEDYFHFFSNLFPYFVRYSVGITMSSNSSGSR